MTEADLDGVLHVNELNVGDVGEIDPDQLATILEDSRIALVAIGPESGVVGFCLVVDATCRYLSPRAAWSFEAAAPDLHLERVAFDMQYSGLGLGLALYDHLDAQIAEIVDASASGEVTLTSLVRLEPPNPHAIGFHAARGFDIVDQATFGDVTVGVARKVYSA